MARPLRIEFSGAVYHIMARGNARQLIFRDSNDYDYLQQSLEKTVTRCGWEVFSWVFMPNHLHLFLRTPRPNLSAGMQRLLSGYASYFSRRHNRPGHLFQGRFKGDMVEDERHFWEISRYIHLNPVRGKRPLVARPQDWKWSSYRGYARDLWRLPWVAYDTVLEAWQGSRGGGDPAVAYRRFVEEGLASPPENPLDKAAHGWLLGSEAFIDKMRNAMHSPQYPDEVPRARALQTFDVETVFAEVAEYYNVDPLLMRERGSYHIARPVAVWMSRKYTSATLRELAAQVNVSRPDSVSNLVRKIDRELKNSPSLQTEIKKIESRILQETKNKKQGLTPAGQETKNKA